MQTVIRFSCFLLLMTLSLSAFSQDIKNIDLVSSDNKIIVTYDLFGKKSKLYNVAILFKKEDGTEIRPKALSGDVGKRVSPGKGKTIIWEVYKDVKELTGSLEPIIKAIEANPDPDPESATAQMAQKKSFKKIRVGWKSTMGPSWISANQNTSIYSSKNGYQGGLTLRWTLNRHLYLQPELLYNRQSHKRVVNANTKGINHHHSLRPQAIVGLSPFGGGFYINGGLYYSWLMSAKEIQKDNNNRTVVDLLDVESMNNQNYSLVDNDFGYSIGGSFDMGRGRFSMGVLYNQGLKNISNTAYWENHPENDGLEFTNRFLQFFLLFGF